MSGTGFGWDAVMEDYFGEKSFRGLAGQEACCQDTRAQGREKIRVIGKRG